MSEYKSGNAQVEIKQDMHEFFMGFLRTVAPNAEKIMMESISKIEKEAVEDWPKRKPIVRTDKDGKVVFFRKVSKNSWSKFQRGIKVDAQGRIVVFLKNTAPYSYMIKYGEDSENKDGEDILQPQGRRVATEVLIKPMRKDSRKVIAALADDLMRNI